ncbi:DUF2283 domain-containing protein [Modestobacter sp. URMC 112]
MTLRLTWDGETDAGYLYLADIAPGAAVNQRVVGNPVQGIGDVVLDFDPEGRLLGVEFLDSRLLPQRLRADRTR